MSDAAEGRAKVRDIRVTGRAGVVGHRIGRLVSASEAGPLVDFAGNPRGPVTARVSARIGPELLARAIAANSDVLLVFESERADRPIVIEVLAPPSGEATVVLDAERLLVEGRDEIVLRCGEASITLRRNGRVIVRGAYVETRSSGVNRIKGGFVKIN